MEDLMFSKFSELMTMKNQLIIGDKEWILNTYKNMDDETLTMAFEGIKLIFKYDEPFFYMNDEYLEKVIYFITEIRDTCDRKYLNDINEIIVMINTVKSRKEEFKNSELQKYVDLQQYLRDSSLDNRILILSFTYDALVLHGILYNSLFEIKEKDFVLASLNYLINVCPSFFKDEDIQYVVNQELNNIKSDRKFNRVIRKYAKDTRNLLKSANKEG